MQVEQSNNSNINNDNIIIINNILDFSFCDENNGDKYEDMDNNHNETNISEDQDKKKDELNQKEKVTYYGKNGSNILINLFQEQEINKNESLEKNKFLISKKRKRKLEDYNAKDSFSETEIYHMNKYENKNNKENKLLTNALKKCNNNDEENMDIKGDSIDIDNETDENEYINDKY